MLFKEILNEVRIFRDINHSSQVLKLMLNRSCFIFADDLINSVRGLQQFSAARAGGSYLGTGDARQEEASLDLLVPNSSQVQKCLHPQTSVCNLFVPSKNALHCLTLNKTEK